MSHGNNSCDQYWKHDYTRNARWHLQDSADDAGFAVTNSTPSDKLIGMLERRDRSLPRYDLCCNQDLEKFVKDRGVNLVLTARQIKTGYRRGPLIEALLLADDNPKFEHFLRLPPELCNLIYDYSMVHFPDTLWSPTAPPLARTCAQIRKEFLPMFYNSQCFGLRYKYNALQREFRTTLSTAMFLMTVAANNGTRHIRRFELSMSGDYISISLGSTGRGLTPAGVVLSRLSDYVDEQALQENLNVMLENILNREEGGVLRMADIHAFKLAIENAPRKANHR